jgi:hypothetical protein
VEDGTGETDFWSVLPFPLANLAGTAVSGRLAGVVSVVDPADDGPLHCAGGTTEDDMSYWSEEMGGRM